MRGIVVVSLALSLFGGGFEEFLAGVDGNLLLRSKDFEIQAKKWQVRVEEGKDLPQVDGKVHGMRLATTPTITLHLPQASMTLPMGSKSRFEAELAISYPLFTGHAIAHSIQRAKLELIKARLERRDLRRRLYMQATLLYGRLYQLLHAKKALLKAKEALDASYKRAKGFYEQGLIPLSDLYTIDAKRYEVQAQIEELGARVIEVRNFMAYLAGAAPTKITLPTIDLPAKLDVLERGDILALREALRIGAVEVELARSKLFPRIGVRGALRRFGDSLRLDGDGYRNGDESYVGAAITYNFYHGGSNKAGVEGAKYKLLAMKSAYEDYVRKAKSDLASAKALLHALEAKRKAAAKGLEAAQSYYELTLGRYENQLVSGDELARSIASLARARADLAGVEGELFVQKCKILLLSSLKHFEEVVR
ncbi:MAG: TolC family protein [Epsilonproteobacteria bacterium]|nr:TolC family protein [Campylobacterota bacterium]